MPSVTSQLPKFPILKELIFYLQGLSILDLLILNQPTKFLNQMTWLSCRPHGAYPSDLPRSVIVMPSNDRDQMETDTVAYLYERDGYDRAIVTTSPTARYKTDMDMTAMAMIYDGYSYDYGYIKSYIYSYCEQRAAARANANAVNSYGKSKSYGHNFVYLQIQLKLHFYPSCCTKSTATKTKNISNMKLSRCNGNLEAVGRKVGSR